MTQEEPGLPEGTLVWSATVSDFPGIAALILAENGNPRNQCIHSDAGDGVRELREEMERLDRNGEFRGAVSRADERIAGYMGVELDVEGGRGWLRGPLVAADSPDWNAAALELWRELEKQVPAPVRRLDAFMNVANRRGQEFYAGLGFRKMRMIHAYTAQAPDKSAERSSRETLTPRHHEAFAALHDEAFPDTITGDRILDALDDDHRVFVHVEGDELLGYLYATAEKGEGEGTVEYVAVRKDARGRGIGFSLLRAALDWFFGEKQLPRAGLVVNEELTNARALYERAGFELKYSGVHLRGDR